MASLSKYIHKYMCVWLKLKTSISTLWMKNADEETYKTTPEAKKSYARTMSHEIITSLELM